MTDPDDDDHPMDHILMPFVTTVSAGGPHDDASLTAGFNMGALDTRLALLAAVTDSGPLTWQSATPYHRDVVPQLDLLAMRHGFAASTDDVDWAEPGDWVLLTVSRSDIDPIV